MESTFVFSAPGRTEISGNHTDHQRGCVLAAAVDLSTTAEVRLNGSRFIRVQSEGYAPVTVELDDLTPKEAERNTTAALVRGVAAAFEQRGAALSGFDAKVRSTVLPGSGLSSSAAFEVLFGTIFNDLFFKGGLSPIDIAKIGQYAENVYFGKPSGLMDQMASAVGGMVFIDFKDPQEPMVEKFSFDFSAAGYALCTIDSGADHADLTGEYAAVTRELKGICAHFGKEVLREIPEEEFFRRLPELRGRVPDRAILRAIHIYQENRRVVLQVEALRQNRLGDFLELAAASGRSSWMYLQNIVPTGAVEHQEMALAMALCGVLLGGEGAFRVNGGGFAGTVLAFVPLQKLEEFTAGMERALGKGCCHVLRIREEGGVRIEKQA